MPRTWPSPTAVAKTPSRIRPATSGTTVRRCDPVGRGWAYGLWRTD
jgi:hypothetical protein